MNSLTKTIIAIFIIGLIAGIVGWLWYVSSQDKTANDDQTANTSPLPTQLLQESSPSASPTEVDETGAGIVKEIEVTNEEMVFTPRTITVNRGDVVRIIYTSAGDTHTFTLPEFNVDTGDVKDGEQKTVEFVAAAPGSFEFYCTPHRDMGMTGTLIVE